MEFRPFQQLKDSKKNEFLKIFEMEKFVISQSEWFAISQALLRLREQQLINELADCREIEDYEIRERSFIRLRASLSEFYAKNGSIILVVQQDNVK